MSIISRRTILAGVAATTAVRTMTATGPAQAQDPDFTAFVALSAALTGVDPKKLAPGIDPIGVAEAYFNKAKSDPAFSELLTRWRSQTPPNASVFFTNQDPVRYLARNIIIAWYLGAWCDPADLQKYDSKNPPSVPLGFTVVSPAAYTQGWVWRVAQAHPMGYSDLRFGYWADPPFSQSALIGG